MYNTFGWKVMLLRGSGNISDDMKHSSYASQCLIFSISTSNLNLICKVLLSFVPRAPPPRRGLVHTVCPCAKYSAIFSVKSFVHFLVHMRKILTKNTELSDTLAQRRFNLQKPAGTLFRHGSIIFRNVEGNKSIKQKGPLVATRVATETLISLRTRFVAAPP